MALWEIVSSERTYVEQLKELETVCGMNPTKPFDLDFRFLSC